MNDIDNLPLSAFMPHHPSDNPHAPFTAKAGKTNKNYNKKIELFEVVEALETVYDPEIPVDIYELGLIYKVDLDDNSHVNIDMTLTAPGCPVAGEMPKWVEDAVSAVIGVSGVTVSMVFDPPWDMVMMSEEAKVALNMM